jgi:hypothetical protein
MGKGDADWVEKTRRRKRNHEGQMGHYVKRLGRADAVILAFELVEGDIIFVEEAQSVLGPNVSL